MKKQIFQYFKMCNYLRKKPLQNLMLKFKMLLMESVQKLLRGFSNDRTVCCVLKDKTNSGEKNKKKYEQKAQRLSKFLGIFNQSQLYENLNLLISYSFSLSKYYNFRCNLFVMGNMNIFFRDTALRELHSSRYKYLYDHYKNIQKY